MKSVTFHTRGSLVLISNCMRSGLATSKHHLPTLDGFRGLAVLMVVAFHAYPRTSSAISFGAAASLGWIGVDLFFVLSGFLITSVMLQAQGQPKNLKNFYVRRCLRLLPLYYFIALLTIGTVLVLHLSLKPWHLAYLLYASNVAIITHSDTQTVGPLSLVHTWSLAVEEQFYLLWPWLVLPGGISRTALWRIALWTVILSPILRFIILIAAHPSPMLLQASLFTRLDGLALGAMFALKERHTDRLDQILVAAGLLLIAACALMRHSFSLRLAPMNVVGLTGTAILAAGLLSRSLKTGTLIYRICSVSILRFYGRYSYGVYLWHMFLVVPFQALALTMVNRFRLQRIEAPFVFAVNLGIATVLALLSYEAIESPFLKMKARFSSVSST